MAKYSDQTELKTPKMRSIKAHFILSRESWIVLIVGYVFTVGCLVAGWEQPASGAILVGCAIAADILFERQLWRRLPSDPSGFIPLKRDSNSGYPVMWGPVVVMGPITKGKFGALLSLAKDSELCNISDRPDPHWIFRITLERVEKIPIYVIAATAILGTVLWGYGHLFFKCQ